jgi:hypothetical protein
VYGRAAVLAPGCRQRLPDGRSLQHRVEAWALSRSRGDIYYHRTISLTGNCNDPNAVTFRATKPGTALVWTQDHAIGIVSCLAMDSESTGTIGVSGRQHIIADYGRVIFGPMYDGTHESSVSPAALMRFGSQAMQPSMPQRQILQAEPRLFNQLSEPRVFIYFASAAAFSIVDVQLARFGWSAANGVGCNSSNAIVHLPEQGFPGSQPGNC